MSDFLLSLRERLADAAASTRDLVSTRPMVALAGGALAAFLVVAIVVGATMAGNGDGSDDFVATTPTETATATETETSTGTPRSTRTPRPSPTATPEDPGDGVRTVTRVSELIEDYGYPEDANFARIRIPRLGVDAQVSARGVNGEGIMPNPIGPAHVVWYDMSQWSGMGGAPGEGGNAIFSGHVDYNANVGYAGVYYRGQGVFSQLDQLGDGDIIEVDYNGSTLRYAVVSNRQMGANGTNWGAVWSSAGPDAITLYTCGGEFDFNSRQYADRVVVRAERIQ